jgi:hypothetical protein
MRSAGRAAQLAGVGFASLTVELPTEEIERLIEQAVERLREEMRSGFAMASDSPYMTIKEAAAYARTTPERIRKLRSRGDLTPFGEGGRGLVSRTELEALIQNPPRRGRRNV